MQQEQGRSSGRSPRRLSRTGRAPLGDETHDRNPAGRERLGTEVRTRAGLRSDTGNRVTRQLAAALVMVLRGGMGRLVRVAGDLVGVAGDLGEGRHIAGMTQGQERRHDGDDQAGGGS